MQFPLRRLTAVWLMLSLGWAVVVALPKGKRAKEMETLFERARALSELEVEGGTPFRLEASVFERAPGAVIVGHYFRVWQSQHRWRDELMFARYSQVRVNTESAMWWRRDSNHQPLSVVQLLQGLSLSLPRKLVEGWRWTIEEQQEGRSAMKCVKCRRSGEMVAEPVTHEWCFDSGSGVLARQTWSDWDTTWEYLDYAPWNGKRYPRQINILQGGERVVEARITELVDEPNPEPATFVAPEDAEEWPRCEKVLPPTIKYLDPLHAACTS